MQSDIMRCNLMYLDIIRLNGNCIAVQHLQTKMFNIYGYIHIATEKEHKKLLKLILNTLELDDNTDYVNKFVHWEIDFVFVYVLWCVFDINKSWNFAFIILKWKECIR